MRVLAIKLVKEDDNILQSSKLKKLELFFEFIFLNYFFSGFLNANGSPLTRGQVANYGIMDQMAVLQWIQENIVQFGGDPQKVTLFGHGTGAACIEYLTHSPTTVPGKNFNPIFIGLVKDYIALWTVGLEEKLQPCLK